MPRPCHCDRFEPGQPYERAKGQCYECWLWHADTLEGDAFRRAWDQVSTQTAKQPGLFRKAVSLGKAIVQHAVAGFPEADTATVQTRMGICQGCNFFTPENQGCLQCGCSLEIKVRWKEQKCPIGLW